MEKDPAAPVYTIRQVTALTNVPEDTIRSWERRYGVPEPQRSAGNQRRYAQDEVDLVRKIQAARDDGLPMDQAIARARSTTNGTGPASEPRSQQAARYPAALSAPDAGPSLARHLTAGEWSNAANLLRDATWSSSVGDVCATILAPAARIVLAAHRRGQLSLVQTRRALAWIERKLWSALDDCLSSSGGPPALVIGIGRGEAVHFALALAVLQAQTGSAVVVEPRTGTLEVALVLASEPRQGPVHLVTTSPEGAEIATTIANRLLAEMPDRVVELHRHPAASVDEPDPPMAQR